MEHASDMISPLLGHYAPDFELPGTDGAVHHLARYLETHKGIGVVFLGNQCPVVRAYLDRLTQLQSDFSGPQFTLIGINTNDLVQSPQDDLESMTQFAADNQLPFPYLRDVTQDVGLCFQATVTPQVFLLDQQGKFCYIGSIDDNPTSPEEVTAPYFATAIAQLLNGDAIVTPITPAIGSPITWRT